MLTCACVGVREKSVKEGERHGGTFLSFPNDELCEPEKGQEK